MMEGSGLIIFYLLFLQIEMLHLHWIEQLPNWHLREIVNEEASRSGYKTQSRW